MKRAWGDQDHVARSTATLLFSNSESRKETIYLEERMLSWAASFFVIAIVAAIFGFTGIAGAATEVAKVLFMVFLVLFIISMIIPRFKTPPVS